ncbi:mucin-2-like [Phymastichus coffea]|uniref:mucin-2-like n=1 Tax=Phymastichus coffea TaxID=108790 RepID=UPI00273B36C3|nr:mucin-2-like [Phymastichus coffea]
MAPSILIAKKKGLSMVVKIPLTAIPRTIMGTRARQIKPAQTRETDGEEESLRLQALSTMPGYQEGVGAQAIEPTTTHSTEDPSSWYIQDMVDEIEREKARLEVTEAEDQRPPRPLPVGQERERLLRWALTFQTRVPEADWRREERQRMEVVRAIREEAGAAVEEEDGGAVETLSEHGTSKSHCSDTSKGSRLSLDGQAEKELADYLGGDAESVPDGKGEVTNPQPTGPSTPPPTLRRPRVVPSPLSTATAWTTIAENTTTSATAGTTITSTSARNTTTSAAAWTPTTLTMTTSARNTTTSATAWMTTTLTTTTTSPTTLTTRPIPTTTSPTTLTTTALTTTTTINARPLTDPGKTIQPAISRNRGHPGWLPVTSATPRTDRVPTNPRQTTPRVDPVDRPEIQNLHYRTASGKRRKYNPRRHLELDDLPKDGQFCGNCGRRGVDVFNCPRCAKAYERRHTPSGRNNPVDPPATPPRHPHPPSGRRGWADEGIIPSTSSGSGWDRRPPDHYTEQHASRDPNRNTDHADNRPLTDRPRDLEESPPSYQEATRGRSPTRRPTSSTGAIPRTRLPTSSARPSAEERARELVRRPRNRASEDEADADLRLRELQQLQRALQELEEREWRDRSRRRGYH